MPNEDTRELRRRVNDCEERLDRGEELHKQVLRCLEENTAAICALGDSTKDVVAAYGDVQAAARVGLALQRTAVWLIKFGGALAVIGYCLNRLIEYTKHIPS